MDIECFNVLGGADLYIGAGAGGGCEFRGDGEGAVYGEAARRFGGGGRHGEGERSMAR